MLYDGRNVWRGDDERKGEAGSGVSTVRVREQFGRIGQGIRVF